MKTDEGIPELFKISIVLILFLSIGLLGCSTSGKSTIRDKSGHRYKVLHMPDGLEWMTENMNADVPGSMCYNNNPSNCDSYGRLYLWKDAMSVCGSLGDDWRLPTKDEWQQLASHYGGVFRDGAGGKDAFIALTEGGTSQFNALLSGGGDHNGNFRRIDAHGFYWTSTDLNDSAWFANFGKGRPALFLQSDGEKYNAFAVRCVRAR